MSVSRELTKQVNAKIATALGDLGYRRRSSLYARPLKHEAFGIVACTAQRDRSGEFLSIIPNVGVFLPAVDRLVAELSGIPLPRERYFTVLRSLAEVGGEHLIAAGGPRSNWWIVDDAAELDHLLPVLIEAIATDGSAVQRRFATLPGLIAAFTEKPKDPARAFRLPVALYLSGRVGEAEREVRAVLERVGDLPGPYGDQYRRFAASLLTRIGAAARTESEIQGISSST